MVMVEEPGAGEKGLVLERERESVYILKDFGC
jgi:hypothetical protein